MDDLVGRDRELAILLACLDEARQQRPQVVVCVGELGIGKTRLARTLMKTARADEVSVGWGAASEFPGAPPYWCWLQVLRRIAEGADLRELARRCGVLRELSWVLPDLVRQRRCCGPGRGAVLRRIVSVSSTPSRGCSGRLHIPRHCWSCWRTCIGPDEPSLLLLQHLVRCWTTNGSCCWSMPGPRRGDARGPRFAAARAGHHQPSR